MDRTQFPRRQLHRASLPGMGRARTRTATRRRRGKTGFSFYDQLETQLTMEPVTSLKFPMMFDVPRLKADLEKVLQKQWVAHYNTGAYSGNWTSIALLSAGGDSQTINALPTEQQPVTE